MKIIFVNRFYHPDHSATSQILGDLVNHLSGSGWEVVVVTGRQLYDKPDARLDSYQKIGNVTIYRVMTTRFGRRNLYGRALDFLSFYVSSFFRLLLVARRGDILVAKTDPPMISVIAALVSKIRGLRLVNWIQDLFPEVARALDVGSVKGGFYKVLKSIRNWSLRCADINVVLGERMFSMVADETKAPERIRIVHNWADGASIVPVSVEDNALRSEWGLPGKFVIGYSGNMGMAHQFDTILAAAQELSHYRDIVFLFIGGGAKRGWIEEQAEKRGLQNVLFREYQPRDQLSLSLGVPDVHLISLNPNLEGLIVPSKFYGIVAAGRPVLFIGDKDGELARMIKAGGCGQSVSPGDTEAAVDYLLWLRANRHDALCQGANARKSFENRYTMLRSLSAWDAVLRSIPAA